MLILIALALDILNILLFDDQLDFLGYYNPSTGAPLCVFRARGLNCLTN
jgi:hypothetical protein